MNYANFYGGIDDDGYSTYNQNGFAYLKHINVHKRLGLAMCEFELQKDPVAKELKESGYITISTRNIILLFSRKTGKIYRLSGGKLDVVATNPGGAHVGAIYYNGMNIFLTKSGSVGYVYEDDFSTVKWSHGTVGVSIDHVPIHAWYTKIYVGGSSSAYVMDTNIIDSKITPGVLTKTQLNIPFTWAITDFRDLDSDLIWGAIAEQSGAIGKYRRFADSFYQVDNVDGPVNNFFGSSNSSVIFGLLGHNGDVIHYTGNAAILRQRIPDSGIVLPNSYNDTILDGRGLVAINGKVWAYHQRKSGHPFALTHAFTCTGGEDARIISINKQGNLFGDDQLFVSWESADGKDAGLDSINFQKRAVGLIVTPIAEWFQESSHDERTSKVFVEPKAGYMAHYHYLPKGSSIEIKTSVNDEVELRAPHKCRNTHDIDRMLYHTSLADVSVKGQKTRITQGHIILKPFGKESPIIRSIELY